MAGAVVSTTVLVLVGLLLVTDAYARSAPKFVFKYQSRGIVKGSIGFADKKTRKAKMKFFFTGTKGNKSAGKGPWKMSAYAAYSSSAPFGVAEVTGLLNDADCSQGANVDFVSKNVVLEEMSGCPGDRTFACYVLSKGNDPPVSSACFHVQLSCPESLPKAV